MPPNIVFSILLALQPISIFYIIFYILDLKIGTGLQSAGMRKKRNFEKQHYLLNLPAQKLAYLIIVISL